MFSTLFLVIVSGGLISAQDEPFSLRIVGGVTSPPEEFPFLVGIARGYDEDDGWGVFCGGSILDKYHVLTAAHCFEDLDKLPDPFYVLAGAFNISKNDSVHVVRAFQKDLKIHGSYNENILADYDIASIKLYEPLNMQPNVRMAALNTNPDCPATGVDCIVAGWGTTSYEGPQSDVRLKCSIKVYSRESCQEKCNLDVNVTDMHICAGTEEGGSDACQGDSGGPLICTCGKEQVQAGIVSAGDGCGNADTPGVYTSTAFFHNWIRGATGTAPPASHQPRYGITLLYVLGIAALQTFL